MKKLLHILFHRVTITAMAMIIQLALLFGIIWRFNNYFIQFYSINILLSLVIVVFILNDRTNAAYKIAWLIPVLLLPVFGSLLYLMFGSHRLSRLERENMQKMSDRLEDELHPKAPENALPAQQSTAATQSHYISNYAHCPPYQNTHTEYLPMGEIKFERLKQELEKAEKYIFLEYFIISEGIMWNSILEILKRKASEGVEVRLIYDDMGCMFNLPWRYDRKLEDEFGIKCRVFHPFRPVLSSRFNNRNHRKIAVIDGHTAFTGGINIADEYINAIERFGHWKDTAIILQGEAAWCMTVMFLVMWRYVNGTNEDFSHFRPPHQLLLHPECTGYVQPYGDNPLDHEAIGENVYINMLYKAKKYVYIITPYLIVDNEMMTALMTTAKSGVDVRIITPHIPDKWYVHAVTRHNYQQLIESGVRVYEYTPGFIHAKTFVVDDEFGVVGTVNLDFRSLYLHFECGVWMYASESISELYADFMSTLKVCQEITLPDCLAVSFPRRLARLVLSAFSPLM